MLRFILALVLAVPLLANPVPRGATPRKLPPNTNAVLKAYAGKMAYSASSEYKGWEIAKLADSDEKTSWFTATGDSPTQGKKPWVRADFPENVSVKRVTILGNREPSYPAGYSITEGTLELLDAKGNVLLSADLKAQGEKHDFDFELKGQEDDVRAIRFTATKDENVQHEVGLAELQVE